jgi:hypothetical protein
MVRIPAQRRPALVQNICQARPARWRGHKMNVSTHKFPEPTQCVLWSAPDSVRGNFEDHFELVKTYDDDNHLIRRLLKCRECGQQYFYEMFEEIDWVDGDDPQYRIYIPISNLTEVEMLQKASMSELHQALPALRSDFPKGAKAPKIYWARKKE